MCLACWALPAAMHSFSPRGHTMHYMLVADALALAKAIDAAKAAWQPPPPEPPVDLTFYSHAAGDGT